MRTLLGVVAVLAILIGAVVVWVRNWRPEGEDETDGPGGGGSTRRPPTNKQ